MTKLPQPLTPERLEEEYPSIAPLAEAYRLELSRQLEQLVIASNISLGFPIESRVKSLSSISEKLERVELRIVDLTQLNDLVGLRLVLLFRRDVDKTCETIRQFFEVVEQYDTQDRLKDDQFGYSSKHFVIKLPQQWLAVPTFSMLGNLQAEIQVRTLAQHIWAASSHKLQYKQEKNVPPPVKRSISRVSALLETVDLELERVLQEREAYRETLSSTPIQEIENDVDVPLNVDLLATILDSELPAENKKSDENYGVLLNELQVKGVSTTGELRKLIKSKLLAVMKQEQRYVASNKAKLAKGKRVSGTDTERARKGVYFNHVGLLRSMLYSSINS